MNIRIKRKEQSSKIGGVHEIKSGCGKHHDNVCREFLGMCCGKSAMEMKCQKNLITKFTTNSDEAFALLVLENGWDEWIKIDAHEHFFSKRGLNEEKTRKVVGGGRYTAEAKGSIRFGGWKEEGVLRFNELCKIVKKDQAENGSFDLRYLERTSGTITSNKKKTSVVRAYSELNSDFVVGV